MKWLRHAFALDDGTPAEPTPAQAAAIDRVLSEIVRRRLTTPAAMLLETCRPLNFVGAQVVHFFSPLMRAVLATNAQDDFAKFLEKRGCVDYLLRRLEELQAAPPAPPEGRERD